MPRCGQSSKFRFSRTLELGFAATIHKPIMHNRDNSGGIVIIVGYGTQVFLNMIGKTNSHSFGVLNSIYGPLTTSNYI